jgi:hypothetical protein
VLHPPTGLHSLLESEMRLIDLGHLPLEMALYMI